MGGGKPGRENWLGWAADGGWVGRKRGGEAGPRPARRSGDSVVSLIEFRKKRGGAGVGGAGDELDVGFPGERSTVRSTPRPERRERRPAWGRRSERAWWQSPRGWAPCPRWAGSA